MKSVNLTEQSATPLAQLGDEYVDSQGRHFVYGQSNGAQSAGGWASYVVGAWDMTPLVTAGTEATNWYTIAVACAAMTDNYYGWFWVGPGTFEAIIENNFAAADKIYTTANAGIPGTDSSSTILDCVKSLDAGVTATRVTVVSGKYPMTTGAVAAGDNA